MPHREPCQDAALDGRLLLWLAHYPLQRAEDLALGLARWAARPTIYRHLRLLEASGLVRAIPVASSNGARCYALSAAALRGYQSTLSEPRTGAPADPLLRALVRVPVWLPLQTFLNSALRHLTRGLATQGHPPRLVRWDWQRDYTHAFTFREQRFTLRADAAWLFGVQGWHERRQEPSWHAAFLLYEPLTMPRLMEARLDRLLRWRESAERWAHYHAMPAVLVLATTRRQAEWWQRSAEQAASRLRVEPPAGAILCQEDLEASRSPWQAHWNRLVSQEQLTLREVLAALPLEALPQNLRPPMPDPLEHPPVQWPIQMTTRTHSNNKARTTGEAVSTLAQAKGPRVRLAWLGSHLSARQWQMLSLLYEHPLLSREELAAFLGVQASSARLLLAPLRAWGLAVAHAGAREQRWALTTPGLQVLAASQQIDVRNLLAGNHDEQNEPMQRRLPWLKQHLEHTAGLYSFFARLAATSTAEEGLVWWETGALCERRYQRQDGWHNFRPDALAEYRLGPQRMRFWLEWDRGTMNVRDLNAKFASYAYYLTSHEWMKERQPLPLLLCVTPDTAQEQRLRQVAQAWRERMHGFVLMTTTAQLLETTGFSGPIWKSMARQETHQGRQKLFTRTPSDEKAEIR